MKALKLLTAILLLMAFHIPASAANMTYVWEPPAYNPETNETSEAIGYRVQYKPGAGDWVDWPVIVPEPTVSIDQVPNVSYLVQVAAVDADGHQGPWSEVSLPGKYGAPGACGRPRVVYE